MISDSPRYSLNTAMLYLYCTKLLNLASHLLRVHTGSELLEVTGCSMLSLGWTPERGSITQYY